MKARLRALTLAIVALVLTAPSLGALGKIAATVTIDSTAGGVALPATLISPTGAPQQQHCYGRLQTAEVRYATDGSAPTTTVGIPIEPLELVTIEGFEAISQFRAIRTTSTSATLTIECWR